MNIARQIIEIAKENATVIATAESCTGGMVAAAVTDIAGSSAVLDCGFVTYSNHAKTAMLGVDAQTIADHGAVSEPVAQQMAEGAIRHSNATLSVAITGIAGPGGSEHKPEGRVCFACARDGLETKVETVEFGALGRENVRAAARDHALGMILDALSQA